MMNQVHRLVLTGGPCGGKTMGQNRLLKYFEKLGWKVYCVPETASVLLGGGIKFEELKEEEIYKFQKNLLQTMLQIENTFFDLARSGTKNCLIICDRGAMDASAFVSKDVWEKIVNECNLNNFDLRNSRYNQVVHMVSAANGAEKCYSTAGHSCRSEGVQLAKELDNKAATAWIGHPNFAIIDNSTNFEGKIEKLIATVFQNIGIN